MTKKVQAMVKLRIPTGKVTFTPPVGTTLGSYGANIIQFTKEFNTKTRDQVGMVIPVIMTVYQDRSFIFITKTPPAPILVKKELGLNFASGEPSKTKVGQLIKEQVEKITETRMSDLNVANLESVMNMIKDTARSMRVTVEEWREI